ncbi:MAG: hypothetical protein R6U95_06240 [Bacteroidales bacterium]
MNRVFLFFLLAIISNAVFSHIRTVNHLKCDSSTINPNKKVTHKIKSNSAYWYDNYFVPYGYQKIKHTNTKDKRKVYFLKKVQFETDYYS